MFVLKFVNGNWCVMVDNNYTISTGSLSLEARHSISREIAKARRQRFETSIFMPKTPTKPPTTAMDKDDKLKLLRSMPRKSKLQHPETFAVRNATINRLPSPKQASMKEKINSIIKDANETKLLNENKEPAKPAEDTRRLQQDVLDLDMPNTNSQPQAFVELKEARNLELENNSDFGRGTAPRRKPKLYSFKKFHASEAIKRLRKPPSSSAPLSPAAIALRNELETEHNILRKTLNAKLVDDSFGEQIEHFSVTQMPERHSGGRNSTSSKKCCEILCPSETRPASMPQHCECNDEDNVFYTENACEPVYQQMNQFQELQLMDSCAQQQQQQDNCNYLYETMQPVGNYFCMQEEEYTIEQTNLQCSPETAPATSQALASDPTLLNPNHNFWHQQQKSSRRSEHEAFQEQRQSALIALPASPPAALPAAQTSLQSPDQEASQDQHAQHSRQAQSAQNALRSRHAQQAQNTENAQQATRKSFIQKRESSLQQTTMNPAGTSQQSKKSSEQKSDVSDLSATQTIQQQELQQQQQPTTMHGSRVSYKQELDDALSAKTEQIVTAATPQAPPPQSLPLPQSQPQLRSHHQTLPQSQLQPLHSPQSQHRPQTQSQPKLPHASQSHHRPHTPSQPQIPHSQYKKHRCSHSEPEVPEPPQPHHRPPRKSKLKLTHSPQSHHRPPPQSQQQLFHSSQSQHRPQTQSQPQIPDSPQSQHRPPTKSQTQLPDSPQSQTQLPHAPQSQHQPQPQSQPQLPDSPQLQHRPPPQSHLQLLPQSQLQLPDLPQSHHGPPPQTQQQLLYSPQSQHRPPPQSQFQVLQESQLQFPPQSQLQFLTQSQLQAQSHFQPLSQSQLQSPTQSQLQPHMQSSSSNPHRWSYPTHARSRKQPFRTPCPPNLQEAPWPLCDGNLCNQHGTCYTCNACPSTAGYMYSTCVPWWYPTYPQTTCCPPIIYPALQAQQQQSQRFQQQQQLQQQLGLDCLNFYRGRRS